MRLICAQPNPQARLRLFCLPYAGASASIFRDWYRFLPSDVEVVGVELPGRGRCFDQPLPDSLGDLMQRLDGALRPYLDRPFALFGHSMGALLAFELARSLRRSRRPMPDLLIASAFRAPHLPDLTAPLHRLDDDAFVDELIRLGGTPSDIATDRELLDIFLPLLRSDFAMVEGYRFEAEAPMPVPLYALGGVEDPHVGEADLRAWESHSTARTEIRLFPGGHLFIHSHQRDVLAALAPVLQARQ